MKVFAFAHMAPDELLVKLRGEGVERADIQIVGDNDTIGRKNNCTHFIFISVKAFQRNRDTMELRKARSYVCDDPISLSQFTFTPADYKAEEYFHLDGFSLTSCVRLDKCPSVPVVRQKFNVIDKATQIAKKQTTFLNQFMTFMYSFPSATHQTPIKELMCAWMASTETLKQYHNRIDRMRLKIPLSEKDARRMEDLMTSPTAVLYRAALQMEGDEDEVAKKLEISAYEMRYIRAINAGKGK